MQAGSNAIREIDVNYGEAVEICEGIHWVGFYDEEAAFHCNPYLLLDGDEAVLFDPGSVGHFPVVARKVLSVTDLGRISTIALHHQDPDLCGSIPVLEELIERDDLRLVCHKWASVFIRYYGVESSFYLVDENNYTLRLRSGRELQFAFTPYVHSPGAIVTFDPTTGVLFSSDLFGSFSDAWDLFATEASLDDLAGFHGTYIPPGAFLHTALDRIESFGPKIIAPQHGSVLRGDLVPQAIAKLREVPLGRALEEQGVPE